MSNWHPLTRLVIVLGVPLLAWLAFSRSQPTLIPTPTRTLLLAEQQPSAPAASLSAIDLLELQANEPVLPPIGYFSAMVERPLFSPNRRAHAKGDEAILSAQPKPYVEPEVVVLPEPSIVLRGTVNRGGRIHALASPVGSTGLLLLDQDDVVEGWKVLEVRDRTLVLSDGTREIRLSILELPR